MCTCLAEEPFSPPGEQYKCDCLYALVKLVNARNSANEAEIADGMKRSFAFRLQFIVGKVWFMQWSSVFSECVDI
mgnify:FL=1